MTNKHSSHFQQLRILSTMTTTQFTMIIRQLMLYISIVIYHLYYSVVTSDKYIAADKTETPSDITSVIHPS